MRKSRLDISLKISIHSFRILRRRLFGNKSSAVGFTNNATMALSYTAGRSWPLFLVLLFTNLLVSVVGLAPHVSLVTWNILAPNYAKPHKYPWSDPQDLHWSTREPRIIEKLAFIDADVICLQEVQVDLWRGLLSKLSKHGYHQGVIQEMGRRHPVANVVLVKEGLSIVRTESRSRALIAVITDESHSSSSPLYLANVHLDAGNTQESDTTRFNQIKSLCKRLQNQVSKDKHYPDEDPTIVIAGDCNILRDSALYTLLSTGSFPHNQHDSPMTTTTLPSILPLTDVYLQHSPSTKQQMTYRSGHVLDYIWISDAVECKTTMPLHKNFDKDNASVMVEPQAWPSPTHPSDHIPIGALLTWSGAPILSTRERSEWQLVHDDQVEDPLDAWTISTTNRLVDSTPTNDKQ